MTGEEWLRVCIFLALMFSFTTGFNLLFHKFLDVKSKWQRAFLPSIFAAVFTLACLKILEWAGVITVMHL